MTGGDSVFLCIKHADPAAEAAHRAPAAAPLPPPPPRPAPSLKQYEDLCAKVAALEGKILKLEAKDPAAAAAEGLRAQAEASQLRFSGLEREVAALKKLADVSAQGGSAAQEKWAASLARFREELSSQAARVGSLEEWTKSLDPSGLNSLALSVSLFEGRLKNMEAGLANELKERFSVLDSAFGATARKASMAQETAAGSARRVEKLDERVARLPYLENRLDAVAEKLERIYELEALSQSLKLSVDGLEKNCDSVMRESSSLSAEHKKVCSDLETLSRNVKHFSALFNQLRTELAFLMPKKQETIGG